MFKKLVNEAVISFRLSVDGPLLINDPAGSKIDPTLPDMSFVRCTHNGNKTVYLPGSSIKGVFRSRYEQIAQALKENSVCNIFANATDSSSDKKSFSGRINKLEENNGKLDGSGRYSESCSGRIKILEKSKGKLDGSGRYRKSCLACKLFGNLSLGSRITFTDAYPSKDTELVLGLRHGIGIDRITGAVKGTALYDIEVMESGSFDFEIRLQNFELYQLYLILWIIQDIDEGKVTIGMGGSRGNGHLRLADSKKIALFYRLFTNAEDSKLYGYSKEDSGNIVVYTDKVLCKELRLIGMDEILKAVNINSNDDLVKAMGD